MEKGQRRVRTHGRRAYVLCSRVYAINDVLCEYRRLERFGQNVNRGFADGSNVESRDEARRVDADPRLVVVFKSMLPAGEINTVSDSRLNNTWVERRELSRHCSIDW